MNDVEDWITIGYREYEDYQGFPLSKENIEFISNTNIYNNNIFNKRILIYRTTTQADNKYFHAFLNTLSSVNNVTSEVINAIEFWTQFQNVDTTKISRSILNSIDNTKMEGN